MQKKVAFTALAGAPLAVLVSANYVDSNRKKVAMKQKLFDAMDSDGNGVISKEEFHKNIPDEVNFKKTAIMEVTPHGHGQVKDDTSFAKDSMGEDGHVSM